MFEHPTESLERISQPRETMKELNSPFSVIKEIGKSDLPLNGKLPRSFRWRSYNIISETSRNEAFYFLSTNVRFSRFLECKKLESILHGLATAEFEAVLSIPGVVEDNFYLSLLQAKQALLDSSPKISLVKIQDQLLERVQPLRQALGLPSWSLNLLHAYLGNLKYELVQVEGRIRKFKKFSGYIKSPSAAGAKRGNPLQREETEIFDSIYMIERDLVPFLVSPTEDFSLLGISARSPIYKSLLKHLTDRKELPSQLKRFILFKEKDPLILRSSFL